MVTQIGNVIRIIDQFTIIINVGSDRLSVGDKIQIYETGDEIKDLDGTVLDVFVHIKDTLTVLQTEKKYSICKKEEKIIHHMSSLALSPLLDRTTTESVPLLIDENELTPLSPVDDVVHIGDKITLA